MVVKRELTASPSPSSEHSSLSPATPSSTPPKKARTTPVKKKDPQSGSHVNGAWTPEKKEELVRRIFTAGLAALDKGQLAGDLGLTKVQLSNATQNGQTNLRSKTIAAARNL